MRAGAMDPQGLARTRTGLWLSAVALVTGLLPAVIGVVSIVADAVS